MNLVECIVNAIQHLSKVNFVYKGIEQFQIINIYSCTSYIIISVLSGAEVTTT